MLQPFCCSLSAVALLAATPVVTYERAFSNLWSCNWIMSRVLCTSQCLGSTSSTHNTGRQPRRGWRPIRTYMMPSAQQHTHPTNEAESGATASCKHSAWVSLQQQLPARLYGLMWQLVTGKHVAPLPIHVTKLCIAGSGSLFDKTRCHTTMALPIRIGLLVTTAECDA